MAVPRPQEGGLWQGEIFWLRLTTASMPCLRLSERFLNFKFNSQATSKALHSPETITSSVADTMLAIKERSLFNSVWLKWVPGHPNVARNENARQLAEPAANLKLKVPEPCPGTTQKTVRTPASGWVAR